MKQLVTIITPEIEQHCVEFRANHEEYAKANGYFYGCSSTLHWPDLPASFSKVWSILNALRNGCETVIWADIDVAFMDMTVDLAGLLKPNHWLAAYNQKNDKWIGDRPYACCGLMVIRNGVETIKFFEDLFRRVDTREVTWHPWEQWHFDAMMRETNFAGVHLCSAKEIGAFAKELWHDGVWWSPGCPTVHLTTPLDWPLRRQVLVDNYLPQVTR